MDTSLSEDEFHRMQLQLIELRTTNYELDGKNKKLERELSSVQEKADQLDKELGKARQTINKSKKIKDVDLLYQESESLQRKLVSQEEEFRLQNQTLLGELALLVSNNEELKKKLEDQQSGHESSDTVENSKHLDEIRRLQAENLVLQKKLTTVQEKNGNDASAGKRDVSMDVTDGADTSLTEGGDEGAKEAKADEADGENVINVSELQLQLETEKEEKRILKSQLDKVEADTGAQITHLHEEVEKMNEKLKRKQESYMQLHAEKETLFKESNEKQQEVQAARDRDQKYYKDQIAKLQLEIEKAKEAEAHSQLATQLQATKNQCAQHLAELDVYKGELTKAKKAKEDLLAQLQESKRAAEEANNQLLEAQKERDAQISSLQEVNKVAEKRKSLLDELAIKYQKEYDAHRESVADLESKHTEEIDKRDEAIEELEKKVLDLSRQVPLIDELTKKVSSLEDTKGWLERRLAEVEAELASTKTAAEKEKEQLLEEHTTSMEELKKNHSEEIERRDQEMKTLKEESAQREATLQDEIDGLKSKADNLKQEIKDNVDEKKIHEKKGLTMLKDLKRQLHAERKRAEKLQSKLQEVLSDSPNKGIDELFRSESMDLQGFETSSVSSFGAGASGLGKDSTASGPQSPMSGNTSYISEISVGDEYNDLLKRVADLQEEKWMLEEKVNHLEMSNACMAEDILNKTSIIEHYVMDSRSGHRQSNSHEDKLSLKKVMDMVNKNSEHTQHTQDMNKKLQSMLEETLTKNMHLQQDLEMMSQEVVRLSKLSVSTSDMQSETPDKNSSPTSSNKPNQLPSLPPQSLDLNSEVTAMSTDPTPGSSVEESDIPSEVPSEVPSINSSPEEEQVS